MDGVWRSAVAFLSLPLTHVVFHDRTKGFRIVAKGIKGVNGITAVKPGDKIIVSALAGGVHIFTNFSLTPGNVYVPTK